MKKYPTGFEQNKLTGLDYTPGSGSEGYFSQPTLS